MCFLSHIAQFYIQKYCLYRTTTAAVAIIRENPLIPGNFTRPLQIYCGTEKLQMRLK
jgi:hypothetical protein